MFNYQLFELRIFVFFFLIVLHFKKFNTGNSICSGHRVINEKVERCKFRSNVRIHRECIIHNKHYIIIVEVYDIQCETFTLYVVTI